MDETFPFKQYLECALDSYQFKQAMNCLEGVKITDKKKKKAKSIKDFLKEKRMNKKKWKVPKGFVFVDEKEANKFGKNKKTFEEQMKDPDVVKIKNPFAGILNKEQKEKEKENDYDDEI